MAGLGFKDFQVGEVLTSADVDGYLMQQTVMRFADSAARGSALGTAPGTAVALAEGMLTYLDDVNGLQVFDGSGWVGAGGFSASTAITATDTSWAVPTLADPIVRVTVVGGGGGGGGGRSNADPPDGSAGNASTFSCSAGTATAAGGARGEGGNGTAGTNAPDDTLVNGNGGQEGLGDYGSSAGYGGSITVAYLNLTGVGTASVTCGAGGAGAVAIPGESVAGGDGGDGFVLFEYRAG